MSVFHAGSCTQWEMDVSTLMNARRGFMAGGAKPPCVRRRSFGPETRWTTFMPPKHVGAPKSNVTACGVLATLLFAGSQAQGQVIGSEQTTLLCAHVTEQAALTLPTRASLPGPPTGAALSAEPMTITSRLAAEERRYRVAVHWVHQESRALSATWTAIQVTVGLGAAVSLYPPLPAMEGAPKRAPLTARLKLESFEF